MTKSLHSLSTRMATFLVMLVAFFAVGTTASADRYEVNFKNSGASTFSSGAVTIESGLPSLATGLVISKDANTLRVSSSANDQRGIGRVVFTLATGGTYNASMVVEGTPAQSMGTFTVIDDYRFVFTPNNLSTMASIPFTSNLRGKGAVVTKAEVYTGYDSRQPYADEFADPTVTYDQVLRCNTTNYSYATSPFGNWTANTVAEERPLPIDGLVRFVSSSYSLLHIKTGNHKMTADGNYKPVSGFFGLTAPAGYAIKGILFNGTGLDGLYADNNGGTLGDVTGNRSSQLRAWTSSSTEPTADEVLFNVTGSPVITLIRVTYVSIAARPISFSVEQFMPDDDQVQDISQFEHKPYFSLDVFSTKDHPFTDVRPNFNVTIAAAGSSYTAAATGRLTLAGNAYFEVSMPDALVQATEPYAATFRFPEGCITSGELFSNRFSPIYRFASTNPEDYTLKALSGSLAASRPGIRFVDLNAEEVRDYFYAINKDTDNTTYGGRQLQGIPVHFDDWLLESGYLSWFFGTAPDASQFVLTDETTGTVHPIESATLEGYGSNYLYLKLVEPLRANVDARYSLTIPQGIVQTADGRVNRYEKIGFAFVPYATSEMDETLTVTPQQDLRVSELRSFMLSSYAHTLEPLKEETYVSWYVYGTAMPWRKVKAHVTKIPEGNLLRFDLEEPIVAGTQVGPYTVKGKVKFDCEDILFTLDGCLAHFPIGLTYDFVPAAELATVASNKGYPATDEPLRPSDFYYSQTFTDAEGNRHEGFFVRFTEPLAGYEHGDRIWDDRPEGLVFDRGFGESPSDESYQAAISAVAYNWYNEYGIFIPFPEGVDRDQLFFTGRTTYHLVMPQGIVNVGQGVNGPVDYTWTIIRTHDKDCFTFTNPQEGNEYPYVKKLHLQVKPGSEIDGYTISTFPKSLRLNYTVVCNDIHSSTGITASAVIDENGEVDITLDRPITVEQRSAVQVSFHRGIFTTEDGWSNEPFTSFCFVDPAAARTVTFKVEGGLPSGAEIYVRGKKASLTINGPQVTGITGYLSADEVTVSGVPAGSYCVILNDQNGDNPTGTIVFGKYANVTSANFQPESRVPQDRAEEYGLAIDFDRAFSNPPFSIDYDAIRSGFTYVNPAGEIENLDGDFVFNLAEGYMIFVNYDADGNLSYPLGLYTVDLPAGVLSFADGTTNAPVHYTWEVSYPMGFALTSIFTGSYDADGNFLLNPNTSSITPAFQDILVTYNADKAPDAAQRNDGKRIEVQYVLDGELCSAWAYVTSTTLPGHDDIPAFILHFDEPFGPGVYDFHILEGSFVSTNYLRSHELTHTFEIEAPITYFEYLEVASVRYNDAGVITDIDPRIDNLAAPLTHFALRYDTSKYSFTAAGGVRQFWVAYFVGTNPDPIPYYATLTPKQDFMGRHWLVVDLPDGFTHESGTGAFVIGGESFKDDNKNRNPYISLVFNVNPTTVNEIADFSSVILGSHAISGDSNEDYDLNGDGEVTIVDIVRKIDNELLK